MNRKLSGWLVCAVAATTVLSLAGPANADAPPTGAEACPSGSFCLYYNSPSLGWGSFEHWSPGSYSDLSQFSFRNWGNNGSGYGRTVYKNAAAAVNNTSYSWNICVPAPAPTNMSCGIPINQGFAGRLPAAAYNNDIAMFIN
ncbi:hypothetical protein ACFW1A_09400 [Kitasatospora sp. NPDC058965]|uniref:hypothetical protein n=1 Tax=Kitasatospora sp. NPDC058965 TaxID=3346682 RepID=UPI003680209D